MADVIIDPETATLKELDDAACEGDKEALKELLDRFKGDPQGLIRFGFGNLARMLEANLLKGFFDWRPATVAAVKARMAEIRRDLGGPDPTPLETLLVERIALNWLDAHLAELTRDAYHSGGAMGKSIKVFEARDRQCQRANDRYVKSLKALAAVRKLKLPNIAVITAAECWPVGSPQRAAIEGERPASIST